MPRKKNIKKTTVKKTETKKISPEKVNEPAPSVKRNYIIALGRRKTSVARVRYAKKGESEIIINNKSYKLYFPPFEFQKIVTEPLEKTNFKDYASFSVRVKGGGKRGQAESIRLGISRILIQLEPTWRKILKAEGLLTRDPREKERKKFGLKGARRAPQWQKR